MVKSADTSTLTVLSIPPSCIPVTNACTPFTDKPTVFKFTYVCALVKVFEVGTNLPIS